MGETSYLRGHLCEYQLLEKRWVYADTKVPIGEGVRPCKRCGELPTPEGYDACMGYIVGAKWVCCGHGVAPSYILWDDNVQARGDHGK